MRDFITKSNKGGVPDSITPQKIGGGEFNSIAFELENSVLRSGQTLAPANGVGEIYTQLAQSLFIHSVKSTLFQAGGTANAVELTPLSGASGVLLPSGYTLLSGARIAFSPAFANTGATTVNIGQTSGTLLGAKNLLTWNGSALTGGELSAGVAVEIEYDGTDFRILPWSVASTAQSQAQTSNYAALTPLRLFEAFQGGNQTKSSTGFQRFPGGIIIQWGTVSSGTLAGGATGSVGQSFPYVYPNACWMVTAECASNAINCGPSWTNSAVTFSTRNLIGQSGIGDIGWISVGY